MVDLLGGNLSIKNYFQKHPFRVILFIALFIRIIAAIFSKGYAFNDDHFDVITVAQHWIYGLPQWIMPDEPPRHSIFYVLVHYAIFSTLELIGIDAPQHKMLVVRLMHAFYSTLIVYFGYKITRKISNQSEAVTVGLILSVIWFMPFMSVRNLVEMVCIPPYLAAFYLIIKSKDKPSSSWANWFFAGALFAVGFVIRYHTILFIGGAGIILLVQKQWKEAIILTLGFVATAFAIQGTIDMVLFEYPFHSIVAYIQFNSKDQNLLIIGPAYRFLLTVLGFLVPPVSLFLVYGYIKSYKIELMMFTAGLVFFLFHSYFPHKQERFILPLFPIIILLGTIGWNRHIRNSAFWKKRHSLLKYSWRFFWTINIIVALALALTFSKKSRVAPLSYLSEQTDLKDIIIETSDDAVSNPPLFYLGRLAVNYRDYTLNHYNTWSPFKEDRRKLPEDIIKVFTKGTSKPTAQLVEEVEYLSGEPNYFVFVGKENLQERISTIELKYSELEFVKSIEPSLYDKVLHFLNPRVHADEFVSIYKLRNMNY